MKKQSSEGLLLKVIGRVLDTIKLLWVLELSDSRKFTKFSKYLKSQRQFNCTNTFMNCKRGRKLKNLQIFKGLDSNEL